MTTFVALGGTLVVYLGAQRLHHRMGFELLQPTLVALLLIGGFLLAAGVPYAHYRGGAHLFTLLLSPAVVALAIPLHLERATLRKHVGPLLGGALLGAGASIALGWGAGELVGLPRDWTLALSSRSATSPISIALADQIHGARALAATMSIVTGVVGATLGPALLDRLGVRNPVARGLAMGVTSHGVGTARMLEESQLAGATSGVGMALGGLIVAVVLPQVV